MTHDAVFIDENVSICSFFVFDAPCNTSRAQKRRKREQKRDVFEEHVILPSAVENFRRLLQCHYKGNDHGTVPGVGGRGRVDGVRTVKKIKISK